MNIAVSTASFGRAFHEKKLDVLEFPRVCDRAGLEAIELNDFVLNGDWTIIRELKRRAARHGLGICAVANATFVGNSVGIGLFPDAEISVDRTLIAFNTYSVCVATGGATLACCDIFGNTEGDWVDDIADQYGVNGNISEDPLFCDLENADFYLQEDSPCAPFTEPNPDCDLIGALPVGCGITEVGEPRWEDESWSSLKALYR